MESRQIRTIAGGQKKFPHYIGLSEINKSPVVLMTVKRREISNAYGPRSILTKCSIIERGNWIQNHGGIYGPYIKPVKRDETTLEEEIMSEV
jgi:hypothetical protein